MNQCTTNLMKAYLGCRHSLAHKYGPAMTFCGGESGGIWGESEISGLFMCYLNESPLAGHGDGGIVAKS